MKLCAFCKNGVEDEFFKYCQKCRELYKKQQEEIPENRRQINSNFVHIRKFKMCSCELALRLPKSRFCKKCSLEHLKMVRLKTKVRQLTQYCVKMGIIIKPKYCEFCANTRIEAHHEDYFQPFKIKWLCKKHHDIEHAKLRG